MKKYEPGKKIQTLDELAEQEFVICVGKVYHRGWFVSWPLRQCKALLDRGLLYTAKREERK